MNCHSFFKALYKATPDRQCFIEQINECGKPNKIQTTSTGTIITPNRDFDADGVLFSFERQFSGPHPDHTVTGGAYEYFNGFTIASFAFIRLAAR